MRSVVVILAALGASIGADAWGKCAAPHAIVSPPGGSVVPIDPTFYLFWPRRDLAEPKVRARLDGAVLPIEQSAIAKTDSFTTYRLRIKTNKPGEIQLELPKQEFYYGPHSWRYQVSGDWKRPAGATAAALKVHSERYRWTCSYQVSQNLKLPGHATAYRIAVFDAGAAAKKGAPAQELVVPPRMRQFFEREEKPSSDDPDEIELGYINCFGNTFAWQGKPIEVEIFALHPDGSEARVSASMRVDAPPAGMPAEKNTER